MNNTKIEPLYKNYEWLKEHYILTKSMYKIAELCSCSYRTIHFWLVKFDIERIGRTDYKHSDSVKDKIGKSSVGRRPMLGKAHSEETKKLMSELRSGTQNSNWKGGKTKIIREFRRSKEYLEWRTKVLLRDSHRCIECESKNNLEVHHKISIHDDIEKALELDNGITLCEKCHKKAHRRVRNAKNKN